MAIYAASTTTPQSPPPPPPPPQYNQLLRIEEQLVAGEGALYPTGTPLFKAQPWEGVQPL